MAKRVNRIITFYSYKGGVGRSMALANVAAALAKWDYKTLVIDWDLEAPGLENYFTGYLDLEKVRIKSGVIDLLRLKLNSELVQPGEIHWGDYINEINIGKTPLHLISAGKRDEEYIEKVRQFDYISFYQSHNGGEYLENLREHWLDQYDLVLIDSRTGLTDSSGICSIHMPDILVLMFTPNEQSFYGVTEVARKAVEGQKQIIYDRFQLRTLPIPCRIEYAETMLLDEWMAKISKESESMLAWLPRNKHNEYIVTPSQLINQVRIPYKTLYAYGERLAVTERSTTDTSEIGYVYETIAAILANDLKDVHLLTDSRDSLIKKVKGEDIKDNRLLIQEGIDRALESRKSDSPQMASPVSAQARSKSTYNIILYASAISVLIISLYLLIDRFTKTESGMPATSEGSVDKRLMYADFVTAYSTASNQDIAFNLRMLKNYHALDKQYQDTSAYIKQQIDGVLGDKCLSILHDYYRSLVAGKLLAPTFFYDTVRAFGVFRNISIQTIQARADSIARFSVIQNFLVDSTFDFSSDSTHLYMMYMEKGNILADRLKAFKQYTAQVRVSMNYNLKIDSFNYRTTDSVGLISSNIFAGLIPQVRIDLFVDNSIEQDNTVADRVFDVLQKAKYTVARRTFKNPTNTGAAYYASGNEIRYNGSNEEKLANRIKQILQTELKLDFSLKPVRNATNKSISIFISGSSARKTPSKY